MRLKYNPDRIIVIPDLQAPFHHKDTIGFLEELALHIDYTRVYSIGDEVDQHALSRYPHDPDGMAAGEEHREATKFMRTLYELFPDVRACYSNHTDRIFRKAFEAGIPRAYLRSIREFMGAPDSWEWRREWRIHDIVFTHGDSSSGVQPHRLLAQSNMCSTVIGHHHSSPGVAYLANEEETIFGMNVGCLVDAEAYAFHYTKYNRYKPVLGAGVIVHGTPYFVPMLLKKNGRWDGANQSFPAF
jgi:hypothetical protein